VAAKPEPCQHGARMAAAGRPRRTQLAGPPDAATARSGAHDDQDSATRGQIMATTPRGSQPMFTTQRGFAGGTTRSWGRAWELMTHLRRVVPPMMFTRD
jgi:hypothetical protein